MQHGEKLAGEADTTLDDAEAQLRALEPDRAEKLIADADATLSDPDVEYYPERGMLRDRLARDRAQLPQVRAQRAARELALAVKKQQEELVAPEAALRKAEPALHSPAVKSDDVDAARSATKDTASALSDGKDLETRDAAYAAQAKELYALVARTEARAALAEKLITFREKPGASRSQGQEALAKVKAEKRPDARASLLAEALAHFQDCSDAGQKLLLDTPELEKLPVELEGQAATPGAVVKSCTAELKPLKKKLAAAQKLAARAAQPKPARRKRKR